MSDSRNCRRRGRLLVLRGYRRRGAASPDQKPHGDPEDRCDSHNTSPDVHDSCASAQRPASAAAARHLTGRRRLKADVKPVSSRAERNALSLPVGIEITPSRLSRIPVSRWCCRSTARPMARTRYRNSRPVRRSGPRRRRSRACGRAGSPRRSRASPRW